MKLDTEVIRYPYITEKGSSLAEQNKYQFVVPLSVNKIEIKKAIENIYNVKVIKINTSPIPSKMKRVRHHLGATARRKKALVTLEKGSKIELL